jgi:hypothetical protein
MADTWVDDAGASWGRRRRQFIALASAGGWSAVLAQGLRVPQNTSSKTIRLVTNDLVPQFLPSSSPFRLLSCKDLIAIRNAYVGFTSEEVAQSQEFDAFYNKVKARSEELRRDADKELKAMQAKLATATDQERKMAIAAYVPLGMAAVTCVAHILPALYPPAVVLMPILVSGVTLFAIGYGTFQLFQLKDGTGATETIAAFNDAKLGFISFISDRMGDAAGAAEIARFNAFTWGAVSKLFDLYAIGQYFTDDSLNRAKGLADLARLDLNATAAQHSMLLASKAKFAEYIRAASASGAQLTERIWQSASLNNCALHGAVPLSRFIGSPNTPVLRRMP